MNISGNTILITGGGTGIGRALAEALHAAGNMVIVAGRRAALLEETVAANPGMAHALLDVADAAAITAFARQVTADHPALNVVINNAGIMRQEDLLADAFDLHDAEETVAINLLGPIRLTAALLPHLRGQRQASVVMVSSGLAFVPLTMTPTYSATKAALHSYSQSLRRQLRDTAVEVIEIVPPAVATDLVPGHADSPHSMPLDAFIDQTMMLLKAHPAGPEICVEQVLQLRNAEANGDHGRAFAMVNG